MKKVFATFFPPTEDVHLTKDVGMIPYIMHREFGYDARIICYKNGDYPSLKKEVRGLKLEFIHNWVDGILYLLKHGKKIDVLQVYHPSLASAVIGIFYKLVNPGGILYCKADIAPELIIKKYRWNLRSVIYFIMWWAVFDMVSLESESLYIFFQENKNFAHVRNKLCYIPDGVDTKALGHVAGHNRKENLILHVGRIGKYQKASEIALEAFIRISEKFPEWRLVVTGTVEKDFRPRLEYYVGKSERIEYAGFVRREDLLKHYKKAKILLMPSRLESFGIAAAEAGFFGVVTLGTNLTSLKEITDYGEAGYLCPIDDLGCFVEKLTHALSNKRELMQKSEAVRQRITREYDWTKICAKLDAIISERRDY
jgi:glycosyltransferase involved in cell wall biosynthesis